LLESLGNPHQTPQKKPWKKGKEREFWAKVTGGGRLTLPGVFKKKVK